MGTRSTIGFIEAYNDSKDKDRYLYRKICKIYQQYDGYLSGVGQNLVDFLKSGKPVNGINSRDKKVFNGIGCLAAQYVAENKQGAGNLYITQLTDTQEYNYDVIWYWKKDSLSPDKIMIKYQRKEYSIDEFQKLITDGK